MPTRRFVTPIIASLAAMGCSRAEPDAALAASATSTAASATPATARPSAPRAKESALPPDDRLGTLPDGVGIQPGSKAGDVTVQDAAGKAVRLGDLYGRGPVLIVFYRGGWCPYCNFQVKSLSSAADDFKARGVVAMDLQKESAQCQGVAAVALATELDTAELAEELRRRLRASTEHAGPPRLVRVAWAVPGGFRVEGIAPRSTAVRTAESDAELLPEVVRKLLVAWAIVPEGVRRVALYSAFAVDGRWDPRCFG